MKKSADHTNALIHETSPYLLMHAHNPVEWYPWNEEALEKARKEKKPILLSIGYTACHWCHVMARESFEDEATASMMNQSFINIKVDREERPDLDKIYQLAYQVFSQRAGGWPLTVFLTPDKHIPFFVGTYYPNQPRGNIPSFTSVLEYISYFFKHHQEEINQQNSSFMNVMEAIKQQNKTRALAIDLEPSKILKERLWHAFDKRLAGFGSAPKFPMPSYLQYLMYSSFEEDESRKIIQETLTAMAQGGIFDQLGGGFFRYSVDEAWMIPHFEKMLYDNAQLLSVYLEAYLLQRNPLWKKTASDTALFIMNTLQSKNGGYFSTLAADSEGEEGKYYVWSRDEIKSILSAEEFSIIEKLYGLDKDANFEGKWHLHKSTGQDIQMTENTINSANTKLLEYRQKRVMPEIDKKILVSWNGLTIQAMLMTGYYLNNADFIYSAERAIEFIRHNMWKNNHLYSCYSKNEAHIFAFLDDYVFLIYALFFALQVKWNAEYLSFALELIENLFAHFLDAENGGFYFTADNSEKLLFRIKQYQDDALPSSNALAAYCLMLYGFLLGETRFIDAAESCLKNAWAHIVQIPEAHSTFVNALTLFIKKPEIIILRGEEEKLIVWQKVCKQYFHPYRMIFMIPDSEKNLLPSLQNKPAIPHQVIAYYCHGFECLQAITSLQELEHVLQSEPKISD